MSSKDNDKENAKANKKNINDKENAKDNEKNKNANKKKTVLSICPGSRIPFSFPPARSR